MGRQFITVDTDNNIMQIYKAPMSKIESEALVRAASRGTDERKTGNSKF